MYAAINLTPSPLRAGDGAVVLHVASHGWHLTPRRGVEKEAAPTGGGGWRTLAAHSLGFVDQRRRLRRGEGGGDADGERWR